MAILLDAYTEESVGDEERVVMKISKRIAPVQVAILPLMKKDGMAEYAKDVFNRLSKDFVCQYDESASIGKRYRRQDEIGTPYAITIDHDSLKDHTVTVRDRDTMEQDRIAVDDLKDYFTKQYSHE